MQNSIFKINKNIKKGEKQMLKVKKIQNKEKIEVLSQKDCSTQSNPYGNLMGCDRDCSDQNKPPYYGSIKN